ncbi:MAG TPA: hypothetical protein VG267_06640 [Terracidiphilus sp.]|jgi:hypothetical protein|nr:hypothetical protein [Terracidiphilus sp.]
MATDYNGHLQFELKGATPYRLRVQKRGFYQSEQNSLDPQQRDVRVVLAHEQTVVEQVSVSSSPPGIDPQQVSDGITMEVPEIINVPYPTSRDLRNLLPFFPRRGAGRDVQRFPNYKSCSPELEWRFHSTACTSACAE